MLDKQERRAFVERVLTGARGYPVRIHALKREASGFATLFPVEVLHLTLACGEKLSLFLKHFGDEQSDHPDKQCRDREVRVYEELLQGQDFPVVRYYGSWLNEKTQRREMYLEYINGWNLKYQPLSCWFDAVRRLAQLHIRFAKDSERLLRCPFLIRLDSDYHGRWAERALAVAAEFSSELAKRLKDVIENYEPVASLLAAQPLTLTHNDLGQKNVVVDRSSLPVRVCFIDWEMAGVGCGAHDLIHLRWERLDPENDRKVIGAYCAEVSGTSLLPSDPGEVQRLLNACELHRTLYRLAHSKLWNKPIDYVADRIERAKRLWLSVQ